MCLECSGRHRALGVHISFVRSVSMDSWTEKQINAMRAGGNDKFNQFIDQYGVKKTLPIAQKYNTPAVLLYKDRLLASIEGRELPTQLPTVSATPTSGGVAIAEGSEPLPGTTIIFIREQNNISIHIYISFNMNLIM
jgi:ADP-ribosylation factor GTPase-activating protein 1